ncbi:MAG: hypothetical protein JNM88_20300 [Chitinophagaceae bacterium]|nr:hypothetical protein [Chitinophagaceae bacterium]
MNYTGVFFLILVISDNSCKMHSGTASIGRVEVIDYRFRQYTHEDTFLRHPFWDITERVWVKDVFAIEESRMIKITSNSKGDSTTFPVMFYRYTNLKTSEVYEFHSFSDTATLIRKYLQNGTIRTTGGWGFHLKRDLSREDTIRYFPDTLINQQVFKHGFFTRTMGGICYNIDAWFLTSQRITLFSLDETSYKSTGVPMVGYHLHPQGKIGLEAMMDITFIADTLTAQEERIFAAWEKYAKQHPVK